MEQSHITLRQSKIAMALGSEERAGSRIARKIRDRNLTFQYCHPELVSGSIPRSGRSKLLEAQPGRHVIPVRIVPLDQVDLPLTLPVLQLLLAQDGLLHVPEELIAEEEVRLVSAGEAAAVSLAMLPNPFNQIGRDADVRHPARFAREDIDARVPRNRHAPVIAARRMLKQVQHDGKGVV